jgi:hypothetical protein
MGLLEDKDASSSQAADSFPVTGDSELSDIWRKLLGVYENGIASDPAGVTDHTAQSPVPAPMPGVSDPWSELLQMQGVEVIDLQQCSPQTIQLSFSEQEVEQALQIMQEH